MSDVTNKKIATKSKVFTISVGAFDFARSVACAIGNEPVVTRMEFLHKNMLIELQKESPDVERIDSLLAAMEECAEKNKRDAEKA